MIEYNQEEPLHGNINLPRTIASALVSKVLESTLNFPIFRDSSGELIEFKLHHTPDRQEYITFKLMLEGSRVLDLFVCLTAWLENKQVGTEPPLVSTASSIDDYARELRSEVTLTHYTDGTINSVARACDLLALAVKMDEEGVPLWKHVGRTLRDPEKFAKALLESEAALPPIDLGRIYRFKDDDTPGYMELSASSNAGFVTIKLAFQPDLDQFSLAFCRRVPGILGGGGSPRVRNALMVLALVLAEQRILTNC
jgi:hypothetical protein